MKDEIMDKIAGLISVVIYISSTKITKVFCLIFGPLMVILSFYIKKHKWIAIIGFILFIIGCLNNKFKQKVEISEKNYLAFLRKEEWKEKFK